MLIIWGTLVIARFILLADELFEEKYKEIDEQMFDYCLYREIVICPSCRSAFKVTDKLSTQFNVKWTCECCGCKFREYPTHTVKVKEKDV
jgi:hypothetical protein